MTTSDLIQRFRGVGSGRTARLGAVVLVAAGCSFGSIVGRAPSEAPSPTASEIQREELEARALLEQGEELFAAGRFADAAEVACRVASRFPETTSFGPSLALRVRAERARGREAKADSLTEALRSTLPAEHPALGDLALVEAEALARSGHAVEAVKALLSLPAEAARLEGRARDLTRKAARGISDTELRALVDGVREDHFLLPTLHVASASRRMARSDMVGGAADAERALSLAPDPEDRRRARELLAQADPWANPDFASSAFEEGQQEVIQSYRYNPYIAAARAALRGRIADGEIVLGRPLGIGALLPSSGSPTMQRFAEEIEEGIRAAIVEAGSPEGLTLAVRDDEGTTVGAANAVRALQGEEVVALIGPLDGDALAAAADARSRRIPIVSPLSLDTHAREGAFSLNSLDPGAARTLAEYAAGSGISQVVVIHPRDVDHAFEAEAFRERFVQLGGSVLRLLDYDPGSTYFEDVLETVRLLEPEALVLPVPVQDIQALAPQVSFFGLDSLGIRLLGTGDWTAEEVLRDLPPRHTNGTIVATPRPPGGELEGFERFVESYEEAFRRSVVDPAARPLGYDAASLVLQTLRLGARTGPEVRATLEGIRSFPGATGVLSVEDGRIVREHYLACIQDGELLRVEPGQRPTAYRPERPGDPEQDEPETVPLGPYQVFCPGVPVPALPGVRRTP